ncbi:MAG: leucine-rich repeat protein [Clostridiales bacterium]|nr:leucine-rich repeat protein [Clostridiales bacterium]
MQQGIHLKCFMVAMGLSVFLGAAGYCSNSVCAQTIVDEKEDREPAKEYQIESVENDKDNSVRLFFDANVENSGQVTDTIRYEYNDGMLVITGTGEMKNYGVSDPAPWDSYKDSIREISIGSGITYIGDFSFCESSNLCKVIFPDGLKEIGEAAFYSCTSLTDVNLPQSVTTLNKGAFADCSGIENFDGPGVATYGDNALQNVNFNTFVVNKNVTSLSNVVLWKSKVDAYQVEAGNSAFKAVDGVLYSADGQTLISFPSNYKSTTYKVVDSCTCIGRYAFANTALQFIDFNNVTTLKEGAFCRSGLTGELRLSDKITTVDEDFIFESSYNITSVSFGSGLKSTTYSMFEDCTGIGFIDFGSSLDYLGMRTFRGCNSLKAVTLPERMTEWGGSVFNACMNLETFTSENLRVVGYADFANCGKLRSIHLGKVEKINRQAFLFCESLSAVQLPVSTKFVDENAFPKTTVLTCLNTELVPFGNNGLHREETIQISGVRDYDKAFEVLAIVNQYRLQRGLSALKMDDSLLDTAMIRSEEQSVLFSHTRPNAGLCFSANEQMVAENIAIGNASAQSVMDSWMNSQGHCANILNEQFKTIGVGCYLINGVYTWVQVFGEKDVNADCTKPENRSTSPQIQIASDSFYEATMETGVIWGNPVEYTYKVAVTFKDKILMSGKQTTAVLSLVNPGFPYLKIPITSGVKWKSENENIASINVDGMITGISEGSTNIIGSTLYLSNQVSISVEVAKEGTNENKDDESANLSGDYKNGEFVEPSDEYKNGESVDSSDNYKYMSKVPTVKKVSSFKAVARKKQLKLTWKKVSKATGYQLQYGLSNSFVKKKIKTKWLKGSATSVTLKNLKAKKKYYVRIRVYKKYEDENGKAQKAYGKWVKLSKTTK